MRKSRSLIYFVAIALIGAGGTILYFSTGQRYGEVNGRVVDALSGDAVRRVVIQVGGKSTIKFTSTSYRLTNISPGFYTLTVTAPGYSDVTLPIRVKRGQNRVDITMKGQEIPDLHGIILFAEAKEKGLEIEIRFTDSQKMGILSYPALPLTLEGTLYLREGTQGRYLKGRELFKGPIDLFWDSKERLARNKGLIPWERIKVDRAEEKHGILEVTLHTPQGDFRDRTPEVELFQKANR